MQTARLNPFKAHNPPQTLQLPPPERTGALGEQRIETRPMTLAKKIINQYWGHRHDSDPVLKSQAQSLIRSHVVILRYWRDLPWKS